MAPAVAPCPHVYVVRPPDMFVEVLTPACLPVCAHGRYTQSLSQAHAGIQMDAWTIIGKGGANIALGGEGPLQV